MDIERAIAENRALLEHCRNMMKTMQRFTPAAEAYLSEDPNHEKHFSDASVILNQAISAMNLAEAELKAIIQEHSRKKDD